MRHSNLMLAGAIVMAVSVLPNVSWSEPTQAETKIYIAADNNKDWQLNKSEFRRFVSLMAKAGNPKAKQIRLFRAYSFAFGIADRNRDGLIAPDELIKADAEN